MKKNTKWENNPYVCVLSELKRDFHCLCHIWIFSSMFDNGQRFNKINMAYKKVCINSQLSLDFSHKTFPFYLQKPDESKVNKKLSQNMFNI